MKDLVIDEVPPGIVQHIPSELCRSAARPIRMMRQQHQSLSTKAQAACRAPLHEECLQHHGHKGDPGVLTLGTSGAIGERAQVILVWVRAPGVENASHPQSLGVTKVRP